MKNKYEKFLQLADAENINVESIKECLNCSTLYARIMFEGLVRENAIKDGKVVSDAQFRKIARYRLLYDSFWEVSVSLQQIIENVLVDDEKFIQLINKNIDSTFNTGISSEIRKTYIKTLMDESDRNNYQIILLASKCIYEMLQESEGLFAVNKV